MLNMRKHAPVVEAGKRPLNEPLLELGQHGRYLATS
jgi:hypothetical protein